MFSKTSGAQGHHSTYVRVWCRINCVTEPGILFVPCDSDLKRLSCQSCFFLLSFSFFFLNGIKCNGTFLFFFWVYSYSLSGLLRPHPHIGRGHDFVSLMRIDICCRNVNANIWTKCLTRLLLFISALTNGWAILSTESSSSPGLPG